jgi:hypothetical protein
VGKKNRPICGGISAPGVAIPAKNRDTCIAIAGLPGNGTISIRKYCVPKAQGRGVRSAPTETWFVWYSEEWSDTLVDLKFLDTVSGDAVAALRDNKGRSLSTGPPEQFVSVHPRRIQQEPLLFSQAYATSQNRIDRLTLVKMSSQIIGMDPTQEQVLGITDMFVLPTGEGDRRQPWILLSFIVAPVDEQAPEPSSSSQEQGEDASASQLREEALSSSSSYTSSGTIHDSYRRDVCINLNLDIFVTYLGTLDEGPHVCNLQSFFEINRNSGYNPVVLHLPDSLYRADVALLPSRKGMDACILHLTFTSLSEMSSNQAKSCFTTPDSFSTGANLPLRNSWSDMQREVFLGAEKLRGGGGGAAGVTTTREGVMVMAQRVVAQNSLSSMDLSDEASVAGGDLRMQVCTSFHMPLFFHNDQCFDVTGGQLSRLCFFSCSTCILSAVFFCVLIFVCKCVYEIALNLYTKEING